MALERDPGVRLRDVAATCLLTERTVQALVADLEEGGYLTRVRDGRRNRYRITPGAKFRHPAEAEHDIAELLRLFAQPSRPEQSGPTPGLRVETPALDTGRDARRPGL